MLLASLGGCMAPQRANKDSAGHFGQVNYAKEARNVSLPFGEPVPLGSDGKAYLPRGQAPDVVRAVAQRPAGMRTDPSVVRTNGILRGHGGCADGNCGMGGGMGGMGGGYGGMPTGQMGITPVPAMGPPGAVAAVGALPAAMPAVPVNSRTSVRFVDPANMRITWLGATGWVEPALNTPARYNFPQGAIYRLKLSNVPNRPGVDLYPTLEVLPTTFETAAYLAHSSVPVAFTEEDFREVDGGNFLVKVIYLPRPAFQDLSVIAGPNEVVSSRLEPGVDPIVEAQRRGTILLIIRMGNIDLQAPNTPAMDAPNPFAPQMPPMMGPPRPVMPGVPTLVPGTVPPGMAPPGTVPPGANLPAPGLPGPKANGPMPMPPGPGAPPRPMPMGPMPPSPMPPLGPANPMNPIPQGRFAPPPGLNQPIQQPIFGGPNVLPPTLPNGGLVAPPGGVNFQPR